MARKVSLPGSSRVGNLVPNDGVIEHAGVRETPSSARQPNIQSSRAEMEQVFPLVDANAMDAQDANDSTQDGDQPSFSMPPFANGRDMRPGR